MIIYGARGTHLKTDQLTRMDCPSCGESEKMYASVFGRYALIFWIPLFPIGKKGVAYCEHCKRTFERNVMPDELKQAVKRTRSEVKFPVWYFSGMVLIGIFIGFMAYADGRDDKLETEYMANPQVGDVYEYKIENKRFSSMKVLAVSDDSLVLCQNQYEVDRMTGLYKIDKSENFVDSMQFAVAKRDIIDLYNEGDIFDINRE